MISIDHRFLHHKIDPATTILIVGTFNPDTANNPADYFYGRSRNFLWRLLSVAFDREDLKGKSKEEKADFIRQANIDFIDLIATVKIEEGQETNYEDAYIDSRVLYWNDVIGEIKKLKALKKVCVTRKSFADIPAIKNRIDEIRDYCKENNIQFQCLTTPARVYTTAKQQEWTDFLNNDYCKNEEHS